jgi:PAS domain S-box-containing protein
MKSGFLDKLIDRLDRLDPGSVQAQFLRLAGEKGVLEAVFNAVQEGLIVVDDQARILYANRAAERMFGFSRETARGTRMGRYLREIDWPGILRFDEREWSRVVSREIEVSYPEHRFLAFYVVPLSDPEAGASGGAAVLFRDVTRERATTAQQVESERMRAMTLLAAGVAHEIGNPLNSLTIHLQLLQRELKSLPEEHREHLRELSDVAAREVGRLDGIITQFLAAIRPVKPRMESCRLDEVVRETLDYMRHEISSRKALVEYDPPKGLPTVRADAGQMRQLFFNIIKNAIEAMTDGGVVRVEAASSDRLVAITVRDTGQGIEPGHISQVFDPYYSTKRRGSGLGMMVVQRIVRDHGGEIEINSERGRGTSVTVFLPREDRIVRLIEGLPPGAPKESPA